MKPLAPRTLHAALLLAAAMTAVTATSCVEPPTPALPPATITLDAPLGLGTFEEVRNFGPNPGNLKMFLYSPPGLTDSAPLVVAMHPCTLTASEYRQAGYEPIADEYDFHLLYPEQQTSNNPLRCFNWAGEYGDPTNLRRNEGENASIINMVRHTQANRDIDPSRIFATGHSGGGAMTALLMATWPDVFSAGAILAGVPYNCTTTFTEVSNCLNPGRPQTPDEWARRVRAAFPSFSGQYPRVAVWQGLADNVVNPINATEIVEQWTAVHATDALPDVTDQIDSANHSVFHNDRGQPVVELYEVPGQGHGTFVDPEGGCGRAGGYLLDADICAAFHIARFFGLTGAPITPSDRTPPTLSISSPQDRATLSGPVNITATASDDEALDRVEFLINGTQIASLTAAPFSTTWDTSNLPNGDYNIRAVAFDQAGNSTPDSVTVTLQGGLDDTTPPTVSITSPADGQQASTPVNITADASDDLSLRSLAIIIDDALVADLNAPPFAFSWDASGAPPGPHTITARATDAAGNSADDTITITLTDAPSGAPSLTFTSPAPDTQVHGIITIRIDADDPDGVDQILLFQQDELIGADRAPPFDFLWDASFSPTGPTTLTARAFDTLGNVNTADLPLIVTDPSDGAPLPPVTLRVGKSWWGCHTTATAPTPSPTQPLIFMIFLAIFALAPRGAAPRRPTSTTTKATTAATLMSLMILGCGGEDIFVIVDGDQAAQGQGRFGSPSAIAAFLDDKTLIMESSGIPSHPNGFDENINFGQATQCYHKVTISPLAGRWTVASDLGALTGASDVGQVGSCDRTQVSTRLEFVSTAVLIENVRDDGACFDITATYPGFGQEGRASISPDGTTLRMEFFFKDQATGHRCADGDLGSPTITLDNAAFTGDAVQTYTITP